MPRGGRSGRSRSRSPSTTPRQTVAATKPMPAQTKPQTEQKGGILSGIGSTIMHGIGFGAGSEVAHQAVRSMMGGNTHSQPVEHQQVSQ